MKPDDDLPRLLDEPGALSDDLHAGLERLSRDLPDAERLARMAAHLGIATLPEVKVEPSTLLGKSTAAKLVIGTGVAGLLVFGFLHETRNPTTGEQPPDAPSATPAPEVPGSPASGSGASVPGLRNAVRGGAAIPGQPSTEAQDAEPRPIEPSPSASPTGDAPRTTEPPRASTPDEEGSTVAPRNVDKTRSKGAAPPGAASTAPHSPPAAPPPTETELLRDARLILDQDPSRALALSELHRREYPNGGFSQEREVIAITALAHLGRLADARARAERFRRLYPSSPYTERIDRIVSP